MDRQPVQSSNIRSVGYDATTLILEVEFYSGGIYQYLNVPPAVHEHLMHASSKGSYLRNHIRDHYRFRRVR
jgi:hypothetical protein